MSVPKTEKEIIQILIQVRLAVQSDIDDMAELTEGVSFSGTLWCGNGQGAEDLAELGQWGPVDHCCRVHDLCPVQLPPYVRYRGAINITPKPLYDPPPLSRHI